MDVTPQLLHDAEFREAKRGGYNTHDVDEFLERLAVGLERQTSQLKEARARIEASESRIADAERRAAQAEQRASQVSDSDETLKRTLVLAQRTADAAIREAREEAARLLADAHETTARVRADAEEEAQRAHREARERVLAEMHELEALRDQLHGDVEALERHLDDQRQRLAHSARVLQALLEDPQGLQEASEPDLSGVSAPAVDPAPAPAPVPEHVEPLDEHEQWTPDADAWQSTEDAPAEDDDGPSSQADDRYEDDGPPTQAIDVLAERDGDHDADDDAYLTELRKAMTDQSPLGPRDEGFEIPYEQGSEPARSRFGRRR